MNRKVGLIVTGILLIVGVVVIGGPGIWHQERIPDAAELREYVDSILDWGTVVAVVPELANYEVHESLPVRGRPDGHVVIPEYSSLLWISSRGASENGPDVPGGFRSFSVWVGFYESEAAMQDQIGRIRLAGFEPEHEGGVTTGFLETAGSLMAGVGTNTLEAFAAKGHLWVTITVIAYFDEGCEAAPFAGRAELERLVELVKENIVNTECLFFRG